MIATARYDRAALDLADFPRITLGSKADIARHFGLKPDISDHHEKPDATTARVLAACVVGVSYPSPVVCAPCGASSRL